MAPKRANKRGNSLVESPEKSAVISPEKSQKKSPEKSAVISPEKSQKKARVASSPEDKRAEVAHVICPKLHGVIEALESLELPEPCRTMLLALAPGCLQTPLEERQEPQVAATKMIGDAIASRFAELQKATVEEETRIREVDSALTRSGSTMLRADAEVASMNVEVGKAREILRSASHDKMQAEHALVIERQKEKAEGDKVAEARTDKKAVEEALQMHFEPLKLGTWETGQAKNHVNVLVDLAKRLQLEMSLVTAMRSSCTKLPVERGLFDQMVVTQLEALMCEKVKSFAEYLEAAEPVAIELAAALEKAQLHRDAVAERQRQAADALSAALARQNELSSKIENARNLIAKSEDERGTLSESLRELELKRDDFQSRHMECFEFLRDRTLVATSASKQSPLKEDATAATLEPEIVETNGMAMVEQESARVDVEAVRVLAPKVVEEGIPAVRGLLAAAIGGQ
eukprot:TRINITY_DN4862_c0_g1_i1.p2 TRINITY_DN4862_c0_g1~~TRINITY_DN4862_c0_g1_i1.p2  ORF type:complete len:460 (+),score=122.99 TRINITY_DN4862_c0_g1_i1:157-1536(+)